MTTALLIVLVVEGALIVRNTWRSARAATGRGNPVWWRMLWWAITDPINERWPGTF